MDWLVAHKEKLNCYEKTLECEDEEGNEKLLQGIQKLVSVRNISMLQLNNFNKKVCLLYAIQVLNSAEGKDMKAKYQPVLWYFKDVFPEEVLGVPSKRYLDFSIDLVPGTILVSCPNFLVPQFCSRRDSCGLLVEKYE